MQTAQCGQQDKLAHLYPDSQCDSAPLRKPAVMKESTQACSCPLQPS